METQLTEPSMQGREQEVSFVFWDLSYLGLTLHLVTKSILKNLFGFLPCGFLEENLCVILSYYDCLSFSDPIAMVMMK